MRWSMDHTFGASQEALMVKNPPAMQETQETGLTPKSGRSLEEGMADLSSILTRRIPWTEESGRLPSMGSQRAGRDWSDLAYMHTWMTL